MELNNENQSQFVEERTVFFFVLLGWLGVERDNTAAVDNLFSYLKFETCRLQTIYQPILVPVVRGV